MVMSMVRCLCIAVITLRSLHRPNQYLAISQVQPNNTTDGVSGQVVSVLPVLEHLESIPKHLASAEPASFRLIFPAGVSASRNS